MLQYGVSRPAQVQLLYGTTPINTGLVALTGATMVMAIFTIASLGRIVEKRRLRARQG